jgi:hypothetical protein
MQVEKAQATAAQIDVELKELQATLANIEEARPFEDLTVRLLFLVLESSSDVVCLLRWRTSAMLTHGYWKPSRPWSRKENGLCQVCSSICVTFRFA